MEIPPETDETRDVRSLSDHLAVKHTELVAQRTVMASERTFSAWIRTGLAAVASGVAIGRLLDVGAVEWLARFIGAVLVLTGIGIYVVAYARYQQVARRLQREGVPLTRRWVQWLLVAALLLSAMLTFLHIF